METIQETAGKYPARNCTGYFSTVQKNQNRSQTIVIITILIRHVKMHALFSRNKPGFSAAGRTWLRRGLQRFSSLQPLYYRMTFISEQADGDPCYKVNLHTRNAWMNERGFL